MRRPAWVRRAHAALIALIAAAGLPLAGAAVEIDGTATISEDVTDGIVVITGVAGDVLTIDPGISVTNALGDAVTIDPSGYAVVNEGDVEAFFGSGVSFQQSGGELTNGGSIAGLISGAFFSEQGTISNSGLIEGLFIAIELDDGGTITNESGGTIQAFEGQAVRIFPTSANATVTNRGVVESGSVGSPAIEMRSSSLNTLDNEGDITGDFDTVVIGGPAQMTNTGTITSGAGRGVVLEGSGTLVNDGTITAFGTGIQVDADAALTNRSGVTSSNAEGVRIDGGGSLTNSGSISGATNAVLVTAGGNVTNQGSLTGGSGAAIAFTGSEANLFTHSGSATTTGGAAAVEMGGGDDTVVLQTGATLSAGIDGGTGTDTLRLEGSGSYDQALQNVELLEVNGTSWQLTGALTVGDTQLNAGSLQVSGSLAGTLSVNTGATLLGGGVLGDVTNRGSVAPGGSIGTLSAASYVQEASGELVVEISSLNADRLAVAGSADIQGGTLSIVPVGGFASAGPFDIVTAGTLTAGQFTSITASPLLTTDVQYTPGAGGSISLSVILSETFASVAATPNQAAVGQAVDAAFASATGDLADVFAALLALPTSAAIQGGLEELSPEPLGATAQVAFSNAQWNAVVLTDHLRDLRLGIPTVETAWAPLPASYPGAMLAASALPAQREVGSWGLHANAYGVYSNLDGGSQHVGYDAATGVFGLGADSWLSERVVAGVDLSAAYTRIDSDRSGTDINGVTGRFSGYASFDAEPAYVDALASYAYHWFDAERRIEYGSIDRRAKSDHGAHEGSGLLAAGLEFSRAGFEFGPEASAQYTILYEESYHESSAGAAGLRFDDRDPNSLGSRLGIRVSRAWRIDPDTLIAPRLRVAWAHEWLDTSDDLSVAFPDTSFGAFEVGSRKLSRDSVLARIGVQALLGDDIVVEAAYGVDVGRSETMSQQLGITLHAAF